MYVGVLHGSGLTYKVEHKADKPMMCCKREQDPVNQEDVLEVIEHTLSIQEVHCCHEEVPVERLCELEVSGLAGDVGNGDDLLEGDDLNGGDNDDQVEVAGEDDDEEAGNHDKGPYRPGDERLSLLLKVGERLLRLRLLLFLGCRLLPKSTASVSTGTNGKGPNKNCR